MNAKQFKEEAAKDPKEFFEWWDRKGGCAGLGHVWKRYAFDSMCLACGQVKERKNPYHWFFAYDEAIATAETHEELQALSDRLDKTHYPYDLKIQLMRWITEAMYPDETRN